MEVKTNVDPAEPSAPGLEYCFGQNSGSTLTKKKKKRKRFPAKRRYRRTSPQQAETAL